MIICSTLPFLKDAKGIFILVIMFNNSYIESVMKTIDQTPSLYGFVDLTVHNVQSAFLSRILIRLQ